MTSRDDQKIERRTLSGQLGVTWVALLLAGVGCGSKATEGVAPEPQQAKQPARSHDETPRSTDYVPVPAIGEPAPPPPPEPSGPMPQNVPPTLLEPYRIAGTKEIEPSAATRSVIDNSGQRAVMSLKLCLDASGSVEKPTLLKSSGYQEYDELIMEQIAITWRFRPYEVNGRATRVCTAWSFLYPKQEQAPTIPRDSEPKHVGGYWCVTYAVGGVKSSSCGTDADYCESLDGTGAAFKSWGVTDRSECEWQETAWQTKVPVDGKREDWFFVERQHCEESASIYRGTPCKRVKNGSAGKRR